MVPLLPSGKFQAEFRLQNVKMDSEDRYHHSNMADIL